MAQTIGQASTDSRKQQRPASERKTQRQGWNSRTNDSEEDLLQQQTLAFQSLLSGTPPGRIPVRFAAAAAERIGNSAMAELLTRGDRVETLPPPVFPAGELGTAPTAWTGGVSADG